jgi:Family of unknown function (DUF6263)
MRYFFFLLISLAALSCKIQPNGGRNVAENDPTKVYLLRLNPPVGAKYYYTVKSESAVKFEVGDKKVDNLNKTTAGMNYGIGKDTGGNFNIHVQYDKLHVYTKNGDVEADMDAANAATTGDPVEKMLGTLTTIPLVASVTPTGEVKSILGYQDIPDKIMAVFSGTDENTRALMRERLKQMVGNGIIKNNISDLFHFFPDSAVHIKDQWKLTSAQVSELNLNTQNSFTLVKIEDGVATIESDGKISRDSASIDLMGYKVIAKLNGDQQGEYEMDVHTGMLISATLNANINGSISLMGQDVPLSLKTTVKIGGQKLP